MAAKWLSRILTMALWAAAAMSLSYWSLKFVGASDAAISAAGIAATPARVVATDLSRAFGPPIAGASAAVGQSTVSALGLRLQLLGVAANRARASAGVALIAVDGKAARPYRVGSKVEDAYTLTGVSTRSATLIPLAQNAAPAGPITLELAPVGEAPTGVTPQPSRPAAAYGARVAPTARAAAAATSAKARLRGRTPAQTRSSDDE